MTLPVDDLVLWHDVVTLSGKRHPARGVTVMRYGCYANGFRYDSHLVDFHFFSLLFFRLRLGVTFTG